MNLHSLTVLFSGFHGLYYLEALLDCIIQWLSWTVLSSGSPGLYNLVALLDCIM